VASIGWQGYRIAAWVLTAALAVAVLLALAQGKVTAAVLLALACAASVGFVLWARDKAAPLFLFLFVLGLGANAAGYAWHFFKTVGPYDELVHGFTIFAITLALGIAVFRRVAPTFRDHPALFVVAVASFGIAVGALWEVAEWLLDLIPGLTILNGYTDTITDLIMDAIGASLAALLSLAVLDVRPRPPRDAPPRR